MAGKRAKDAGGDAVVTIAHVIELIKNIESNCRLARTLLQRLDPKAEIKLTAEIKELLSKPVKGIMGMIC